MEQAVGGGELRQQLISDTISSSYFESDGFSACQGSFSLSLASDDGEPLPQWVRLDGSFAVLKSESMIDREDSVLVHVTLGTDTGEQTATFQATLACQSTECDRSSWDP